MYHKIIFNIILNPQFPISHMVENSQEYRLKYWATRSSVRSFACSGLLASLAPSAALTRSLRSLPRSWDSE